MKRTFTDATGSKETVSKGAMRGQGTPVLKMNFVRTYVMNCQFSKSAALATETKVELSAR